MKGVVLMNNKSFGYRGGFFGPFILGGITGALVTPLFYNNNRYNYYPYPYYYGPYYRPY